jgi:hypothetical protein
VRVRMHACFATQWNTRSVARHYGPQNACLHPWMLKPAPRLPSICFTQPHTCAACAGCVTSRHAANVLKLLDLLLHAADAVQEIDRQLATPVARRLAGRLAHVVHPSKSRVFDTVIV